MLPMEATSRSEDQRPSNNPNAPPTKREDEAFGKQLTNDPPTAGAQGEAHGDFLPARRSAREEHVRQIETSHEEHDARHSEKKRRQLFDLAVAGWAGAGRETRERFRHERLVFLLDRIGLLEVRRQSLERRFGGRGGHAGFEARDDQELLTRAIGQGPGIIF